MPLNCCRRRVRNQISCLMSTSQIWNGECRNQCGDTAFLQFLHLTGAQISVSRIGCISLFPLHFVLFCFTDAPTFPPQPRIKTFCNLQIENAHWNNLMLAVIFHSNQIITSLCNLRLLAQTAHTQCRAHLLRPEISLLLCRVFLCEAEYTQCRAGMSHKGRSFALGRGLVFSWN